MEDDDIELVAEEDGKPYASYYDGDGDDDDDDDDAADLQIARAFLNVVAMQSLWRSLMSPLEVANLMWQVQYAPIRDYESDDDDDDVQGQQGKQNHANEQERDAAGNYIVAPSHHQADIDYLNVRRAPSVPRLKGTWSGMRAIARREGMLALWKGHAVNTTMEFVQLVFQPLAESLLNESLDLHDPTIFEDLPFLTPNLATIVASHALVTAVLHPLQVVRTRLVVQKSTPKAQKYQGFWHCVGTMVREEGVLSLFRGVHLAVVHSVVWNTLSRTSVFVLDSFLGISKDTPFYFLGDLMVTTIALSICFPIRTIQRRMQVQWMPWWKGSPRKDKLFDTCVRLSPLRYTSSLDCLVRIVREEGWTSLFRGFMFEWTGAAIIASVAAVAAVEVEEYATDEL